MCSITYLMPMLSNFELPTPSKSQLDAPNVKKSSVFLDFAPKLTFFAAAFIYKLSNEPNTIKNDHLAQELGAMKDRRFSKNRLSQLHTLKFPYFLFVFAVRERKRAQTTENFRLRRSILTNRLENIVSPNIFWYKNIVCFGMGGGVGPMLTKC